MRLSSITKGKMKFSIKVLSTESGRALSPAPMSEHRFEEIRETTGIASGEPFTTVGRIPICSVAIRESLTCTTESSESAGTAIATCLLLCSFLSFELISMFPVLPVFVILLTFLGVTQYFIGFIYLLKLVLCTRVIRVQVRMILTGQLTKSLFYIILRSTFVNSKNLIIIYIGHVL